MFEIWVLFELLDFLIYIYQAKITKMSYSLNHFKITLNDCKFDLFYQKNILDGLGKVNQIIQ